MQISFLMRVFCAQNLIGYRTTRPATKYQVLSLSPIQNTRYHDHKLLSQICINYANSFSPSNGNCVLLLFMIKPYTCTAGIYQEPTARLLKNMC